MTRYELKQLRKLLFIEVTEAAKFIADCESRTWQRYESGSRSIPLDVEQTIQQLALTRQERLQFEYDDKDPNYRYFDTFEEYKEAGGGGNELMWRLAQSVATALLCERESEKWRIEETITV